MLSKLRTAKVGINSNADESNIVIRWFLSSSDTKLIRETAKTDSTKYPINASKATPITESESPLFSLGKHITGVEKLSVPYVLINLIK